MNQILMFHGTTQFDLHLFKLSDLFLLLKLESKVTISQGPKLQKQTMSFIDSPF